MKTIFNQTRLLTLLLLLFTVVSFSQPVSKELASFDKIVAGPHIEMTLKQGEHEMIEVTAENVSPDNIVIKVRNGTLKIYLKDWRKHEMIKKDTKKFKAGLYRKTKVHATVTFNRLRKIVAIGEEKISSGSIIKNDKFRMKIYGEAKVCLRNLEVNKLITKLFGENEVAIQSGKAVKHKSKLFGENSVIVTDVYAQKTKCTSFGENEFAGNSEKKFKVNSFGESEFNQHGTAKIHKMIVLGENKCCYADNHQ